MFPDVWFVAGVSEYVDQDVEPVVPFDCLGDTRYPSVSYEDGT